LDLPNESGISPKLKRENAESNSKSKTAATLLGNKDGIFWSLAQKTHGFDPKGNDLIDAAQWLANFTKWSDKLAQWLSYWRAAAFLPPMARHPAEIQSNIRNLESSSPKIEKRGVRIGMGYRLTHFPVCLYLASTRFVPPDGHTLI
jgi:hypothetical protein